MKYIFIFVVGLTLYLGCNMLCSVHRCCVLKSRCKKILARLTTSADDGKSYYEYELDGETKEFDTKPLKEKGWSIPSERYVYVDSVGRAYFVNDIRLQAVFGVLYIVLALFAFWFIWVIV